MTVAGLILAAGRSARMAPRNKLLETIGGKPVIARVADIALASGAKPVVVVTGFDAARVAEALRGLAVTLRYNAAFEAGLSTSLRAGIAALPANIDGALVLLGDMPFVEPRDLEALIAAFANRESICVPARNGRLGNPILWGASYFPEMMQLDGDAGAKRLLEVHDERVIEVAASSDGIFADIDTLSDLARLDPQTGSQA